MYCSNNDGEGGCLIASDAVTVDCDGMCLVYLDFVDWEDCDGFESTEYVLGDER